MCIGTGELFFFQSLIVLTLLPLYHGKRWRGLRHAIPLSQRETGLISGPQRLLSRQDWRQQLAQLQVFHVRKSLHLVRDYTVTHLSPSKLKAVIGNIRVITVVSRKSTHGREHLTSPPKRGMGSLSSASTCV